MGKSSSLRRSVYQFLQRPKAALPGHTLLQVSRLANPAYQLEVEIIAILPARA